MTSLRIVGLQESRRVQVVAGADEHVVVDDHRSRGREVLLVEIRNLHVPALFARACVQRDEVIVGRLEEQVVVPERSAAVADVRTALGFPVVVPDHAAVPRIDRPHVVGRRDVEDVVHHQDRPFDIRRSAGRELAGAFAADNHPAARQPRRRRRRRRRPPPRRTGAATRRQARHPCEREVLDRRLIDLRERAEAPACIVARVDRP